MVGQGTSVIHSRQTHSSGFKRNPSLNHRRFKGTARSTHDLHIVWANRVKCIGICDSATSRLVFHSLAFIHEGQGRCPSRKSKVTAVSWSGLRTRSANAWTISLQIIRSGDHQRMLIAQVIQLLSRATRGSSGPAQYGQVGIIGAEFAIDSAPGRGAVVRVEVGPRSASAP
jgi:hypothetical protein